MTSWKLSLPCTRAEAEAIEIDQDSLAGLDPPPVLMTSERVVDDPEAWQLDAYFDGKPAPAALVAVRALVPSASGVKAKVVRVPDEDWVTLSQSGIEPVRAGRFYVHTGSNRGNVPEGAVPFRIEAGLAFGTGQHETTTGCLLMLDAMKRQGAVVRNHLDLGTGTGLLAFAAMHLWPHAYATASDIDPVSIDVVRENAAANNVPLGRTPGKLALAVAPGLEHPLLIARAPYDLIAANILAGPLIELAPVIAMALAPRGQLILAGLLATQADAVLAAYRRRRCMLVSRRTIGDWTILRLAKR